MDNIFHCTNDSLWINIFETNDDFVYTSGVPTGDMEEHYKTEEEVFNLLYDSIDGYYKTKFRNIKNDIRYIKNMSPGDYDGIKEDIKRELKSFLRVSTYINEECIKTLNKYGIIITKFSKPLYIDDIHDEPTPWRPRRCNCGRYFVMTHSFFNKWNSEFCGFINIPVDWGNEYYKTSPSHKRLSTYVSKLLQVKYNGVKKSKKEIACYKVLQNEYNDLVSQYKITDSQYSVDYFSKKNNLVIEFLGDWWHGNPDIYARNKVNTKSKKTIGQLYDETFDRLTDISKKGFNIKYIWENDWKRYLIDKKRDNNINIKDYLKSLQIEQHNENIVCR